MTHPFSRIACATLLAVALGLRLAKTATLLENGRGQEA